MPCNKHFSELMKENLNDSSSLFLILASGSNIDISEFNNTNNRVFFDRDENHKNNLFYDSKILFFKGKQIDTMITIDARKIDIQIKKINELINTEN